MGFYIGQIFEEIYPPEAAEWCNENNARMIEIEPKDGVRCFQIAEIPAPTEEEINKARIAELKQLLSDSDYAIIKIAEGAASVEEYAELIEQRKAWRDEINALEG